MTPEVSSPHKDTSPERDTEPLKRKNKKLRSAWISFVGRIVAQLVGAVASITLGLLLLARYGLPERSASQASPPPATVTQQQTAKAREAELIIGELKGVRDLYERNLVPITRLNALERDAASIEGQRGQLIAAVAQAESRIAETQFQIIQIDEQMRAEAMQELRRHPAG